MLNLLFVLAGIYKSISIFIDGSFFVPYLFFILHCPLKKNSTLHCLSVWNVVKDHRALLWKQAYFLPESACKGRAFF